MPRIEIPEDPKEKLEAFKKNIIIPDPSRVVIKPNTIQELIPEETLKNILSYKLQLELEKNFEHQAAMFGDNDILSKLRRLKLKQYPLSQQEAFQKDKQ